MYIFAHLHKCAGSSIINAAIEAGFVLPKGHANGNPVDHKGKPINYFSRMTKDQLENFLLRQKEAGVEFLAMEWDFPSIENLPEWPDLRIFTVFRDPIERYISNMKMDAAFGWDVDFDTILTYINGSAPYRSNNYYTRFFSGCAFKPQIDAIAFDNALRLCKDRVKYEFIGNDLDSFMRDLFDRPIPQLQKRNQIGEKVRYLNYDGPINFDINEEQERYIVGKNIYDYALIAYLSAGLGQGRANQCS